MTPGGSMRFLLTSAGIKNTSIHDALVDLLGKPIAESSALCIPTAAYGHPMAGPAAAWRFIAGQEPRTPMCALGADRLGELDEARDPAAARPGQPGVEQRDRRGCVRFAEDDPQLLLQELRPVESAVDGGDRG